MIEEEQQLPNIQGTTSYGIDEFHSVGLFDSVALEGVLLLLHLRTRVQVLDGNPATEKDKFGYLHRKRKSKLYFIFLQNYGKLGQG